MTAARITGSAPCRRLERSGAAHTARLLAAVCAALLVGGCARLLPGGVPCPRHGGAAWREYRSEHFEVASDLDRDGAAALIQELESIRALEVVVLAGEGQDVPGRLRVVAPTQERTFQAIAPPGVLGYYLVSGLGEPTVVLHAAALGRDPEVFAHELAHHLAWHLYPRQPPWFTEGLAQFVQTVASPDPQRRGWAGRVPRIREARRTEAPPVRARELLAWKGGLGPADTEARELWSWVLYHWLWSEHRGALAAYQRRLAAGEDPRAAWAAAFPELDPAHDSLEALDRALDRHRRRGDLSAERVVASGSGAFRATPLSSADVHVLLVEARAYWELSPRQARADAAGSLEQAARLHLQEALKEDPLQPRALSRVAELEGADALPLLRRASAARPGDFSAWFLLGDALDDAHDVDGSEAAYRRSAALNPDHAVTQNNLAWLLAKAGREQEALPFARRAVDLAPWDANVVDTLALVLDGLGSCPDALRLQRRAVDLLNDSGAGDVVKGNPQEIREHLADYAGRCGSKDPTADRLP